MTKQFPRLLTLLLIINSPLPASFVWLEGEDANPAVVTEHSWYGSIHTNNLSNGALAHHWDDKEPGKLTYRFEAPEGGNYVLWLRANATRTKIQYEINGGAPQTVPPDAAQTGHLNVARDDKIDLRFIAWIRVGEVTLKTGNNTLVLTLDSANHHHGMVDAIVFTNEPFRPSGVQRPDEKPKAKPGWSVWQPNEDSFKESPLDMRWLNQERSGLDGRVIARDGQFFFEKTDEPVRFWAVNGPGIHMRGEELAKSCRLLAKRGVNLLRIHGAVFDGSTGAFKPTAREGIQALADEAEKNGIYLHLSIYFPLWFRPEPGLDFLKGYDGKQRSFSVLFFNKAFQELYHNWWRELLLVPGPDGRKLIDHPALMSVEIQNEDSNLFWTFNYDNIPAEQMHIYENVFGNWVKQKYGSFDEAYKAWDGLRMKRDRPQEGRLAFRPIGETFTKKTKRDQDTITFLYEDQRRFYQEQVEFLRNELGFKGLITASNWQTASPAILGPLEYLSYYPGDFIDRHGAYFGSYREGTGASWSIRTNHVTGNRNALKFDPQKPGETRSFSHPVMDIQYGDYPSTISETSWTRPNRYRGESQLYYAIFGALQDVDSIMHFALHGTEWQTQQHHHVDPWTIMTPTQMGQYSVAALIYRKGLVKTAPRIADIQLKISDLLALKGTPLSPRSNLDMLRAKDLKAPLDDEGQITSLIHYVGQTHVDMTEDGGETRVDDLSPYIDLDQEIIRSATGEIQWDYGDGVLAVNAPQAQIIMGDLSKRSQAVVAGQYALSSDMDAIYTALVSLDDQPVETSRKLLFQVMTEEEPTDYETESAGNGLERILNLGRDPWLFKSPHGTAFLARPDAQEMTVTPLDLNGYPQKNSFTGAKRFELLPDTVYYLIEK
ncbi:hypothetical protein [Cerasicoccus arenae]|uniref:Glycoside hydrolase family 42 N-terminal domain-containing protein n=1 Tax=Cerasicoccus arenae TaxID=424488 RepID=A0A8J3DD27_9BACT|nr:hypothetical protein [Cerasicoccus arenae]MBK1859106.1 hypothetical protein [Cerasicoccus arenae]GHB91802.1 hypothetical protein GCM10007047_03370 [Cerasicoccus arenae]